MKWGLVRNALSTPGLEAVLLDWATRKPALEDLIRSEGTMRLRWMQKTQANEVGPGAQRALNPGLGSGLARLGNAEACPGGSHQIRGHDAPKMDAKNASE